MTVVIKTKVADAAPSGGELSITPLTGAIGAAISGVRLADISEQQFQVIRQAFHDNCMLVFRDQFLTIDEHIAFAARWGEFEINAMSPYLDDYPMVLPLSKIGRAHV